MEPQSLYLALAGLLVLIGLIGVVLPALPGLPLIFAGLLLAAWADGFQHVGPVMLGVLGVLTALSLVVDFWATGRGAKRLGASRLAVAGGTLGTLAGAFVFPPVGLFAGPFVGAVAGELWHRRSLRRADLGEATRIGLGTLLGLVLGVALKLAIAGLMLGLFALGWSLH